MLFCADPEKVKVSNQMADAAVMQATLQAHALTVYNDNVTLMCELTNGGFTRKLASGMKHSAGQVRHRCTV